jgi:hypothetical protein
MYDDDDELIDDQLEGEPEFVELFAGDALTATDAQVITLRSPTHVVVFAGAVGSGKTTVLASIYERLNQGSFAGFKFARSRTLLGFEQICHSNRLESGRVQPDTLRTALTHEAKYYHLALRPEGSYRDRRDVLLSAMSGELFRMAKDKQEEAERLTFLRRADTFVVLVDGGRLADKEHRNSAKAHAVGILQSLLDAEMVRSDCRVEIVFSKFDRIAAAGEPALRFLQGTQEYFENLFRPRVPHLLFRNIAARATLRTDHENTERYLADAFASWMMPLPQSEIPEEQRGTRVPSREEREFSKYGWRYFERIRGNQ